MYRPWSVLAQHVSLFLLIIKYLNHRLRDRFRGANHFCFIEIHRLYASLSFKMKLTKSWWLHNKCEQIRGFFLDIFSSPGLSYCHHFSSVVRPSTFHILIFCSEITGPIATKLWWNGPWISPFQNCVRWSRLPTKMAAKLKI